MEPGLTIVVGGGALATVSVDRMHGHTAEIALVVAANRHGITGSGAIAAGASSGTVMLTVAPDAAIASNTLAIDGSDGGLARSAEFDVRVVPSLEIATRARLAVGSIGLPYATDLAVTGGAPPYTWTVVGGGLPPGLTVASSGALEGSPTAAGSYTFSVQVTDALGDVATTTMDLLVTTSVLGSLVGNGSFESGYAGWSLPGSGAGVQFTVVSDAVTGSSAARVTNRAQLFQAPGQNVFSPQLQGASGTPVTTRFWVKVDAPAMVRANINLVTLAERVVRTADVWTEVTGTTTLSWSGTLIGASIDFMIGQQPENVANAFTLDDVRIERDADADGIPDAVEPPRAACNPDRDADGLPDGWETSYAQTGGLDPGVADADADADGDGFTNQQEYWAATDPLAAGSRPGAPSAPAASPDTQAIARYLALLPSRTDNRVIAGQHVTGSPSMGGIAGELAGNVTALYTKTGKWPGLVSFQYEGADASVGPLQVTAVNTAALDWAASGGLVLIKYQPFDPWTLATTSTSGAAHVDLVGLIDPAAGAPANLAANTLANARWMDWLDQVATGLEQLRAAHVTVLWRPLSEMNNSAHWHSRQPRAAWIALWRHMYDYLTHVRGLDNLLWVYEADATAHATTPADCYYPGDDAVDLMGHNLYSDSWTFPYDLNEVFRRYSKIYGFPQAGSGTIRDGSWDNRTIAAGLRAAFPRASLFCAWNDFYSGGGSTLVTRSLVSQRYAQELIDDPWIVTRDELVW